VRINPLGIAAGLVAGALVLTACGSSKSTSGSTSTAAAGSTTASSSAAAVSCVSGSLKAEGSTAQKNAMDAWVQAYQKQCSGATVTYNGTGSGAGVSNFIAKQDNFAGSDSALDPTKSEVTKATTACGSPALDLPMVVGPIAVAYKVNGVTSLTLTPKVITQIFLGKITTWNDPAIAAINSGVTLPATKITVFYRSDSSGTTQNFEKYLAANDPTDFTTKPDKDSSKAGFAGQGKTGSQGVQQAIGSSEGRQQRRRGPHAQARLRDEGLGRLPDHPGHVRDRLLEVLRCQHRLAGEVVPDVHLGRRTGVAAGPRLRTAAERDPDPGSDRSRGDQLDELISTT
jgi:phosphate transport system substrate-binding protein